MKHYFVINPEAGHGKAKKLIPQINNTMNGKALSYSIHITRCPGDGEEFVREKARDGRSARFYVCGGDGTLHEAMNGVFGYPNASIGLIPTGTGNDFVKNFTNKAAFFDFEAQLNGEEIPVDLIGVNDKVAVNMINIGLDCEVVVGAARLKKYPFIQGGLAYGLSLCRRFCEPMGEEMEITDEEGMLLTGEFLLCTIANGSYCGSAFQSSPYARIDDGLLDFGGIRRFNRRALLKMLPNYQNGTYLKKMQGDKRVHFRQCEKIWVHVRNPLFASIDGEIVSFTDLHIKVEKNAARFILPKGATKIEKPTVDWR